MEDNVKYADGKWAYCSGYAGVFGKELGSELNHEDFTPICGNHGAVNKPIGGLWVSECIAYRQSAKEHITTRWLNYMGREGRVSKDGFFVELADDFKMAVIDSKDKFEYFHEKYPNVDTDNPNSLDYLKMSLDYDGVCADFGIYSVFKSWSISSAVIFSLDKVKGYRPFEVDNSEYDYIAGKTEIIPNIINIKEAKELKPSKDYLKLKEVVRELTNDKDLAYFADYSDDKENDFKELSAYIASTTKADEDKVVNILHTLAYEQYRDLSKEKTK